MMQQSPSPPPPPPTARALYTPEFSHRSRSAADTSGEESEAEGGARELQPLLPPRPSSSVAPFPPPACGPPMFRGSHDRSRSSEASPSPLESVVVGPEAERGALLPRRAGVCVTLHDVTVVEAAAVRRSRAASTRRTEAAAEVVSGAADDALGAAAVTPSLPAAAAAAPSASGASAQQPPPAVCRAVTAVFDGGGLHLVLEAEPQAEATANNSDSSLYMSNGGTTSSIIHHSRHREELRTDGCAFLWWLRDAVSAGGAERQRWRREGRVLVDGAALPTPMPPALSTEPTATDRAAAAPAVAVAVVSGRAGPSHRCGVTAGQWLRLCAGAGSAASSNPRTARAEAEAEAALRYVGVSPRLRLSGGVSALQRWCLCVAAALVARAPLLLLPDPFADVLADCGAGERGGGAAPLAVMHAARVLAGLGRVWGRTAVACVRRPAAAGVDLLAVGARTLLVLGAGGHALYSGPAARCRVYFAQLRVPRAVAEMAAVAATTTPARLSSSRIAVHQRCASPPQALTGDDGGGGGTGGGGPVVEVAGGPDVEALAGEWAASLEQTLFYAAKYYDSPLRRRLQRRAALADESARRRGDAPQPPRARWWRCVELQWRVAVAAWGARGPALQALRHDACVAAVAVAVTAALCRQPRDQRGLRNTEALAFALQLLAAADGAVRQTRHAAARAHRGLTVDLCRRRRRWACAGLATLAGDGGAYAACALALLAARHALFAVVCFAALAGLRAAGLLAGCSFSVLGTLCGLAAAAGAAHACVVETLLLWCPALPAPRRRNRPRRPLLDPTVAVAWAVGLSVALCGFALNPRSLPSWAARGSLARYTYAPSLRAALLGAAATRPFACGDPASDPAAAALCLSAEELLRARGLEGAGGVGLGEAAAAVAVTVGVAAVAVQLGLCCSVR